MYFKDLIKKSKSQFNCTNSGQLYSFLGGEKALKIKLRQFQLIEAGAQNPSSRVLSVFLEKVQKSEWHEWIAAFVVTLMKDTDCRSDVSDYLKQHLTPAFEKSKSSTWTAARPFSIFSDNQLELLSQDSEAFLLFKRILIDDGVESSQVRAAQEVVQKLIDLKLIQRKKARLIPTNERFRAPDPDISPPRTTAKSNKYILAHLTNYLTLEGNQKQVLRYGQQYMLKEKSELVREQLLNVRNWIQSLAISDGPPDQMVPFVFVLFGKELERRELG
jgi:hypothetical protein